MTIALILLAVLVAFGVGFFVGRGRRSALAPLPPASGQLPSKEAQAAQPVPTGPATTPMAPAPTAGPSTTAAPEIEGAIAERARLIRSYEAEAARLRARAVPPEPTASEHAALRSELARVADELAAARSDAARYRQLVIDLEENAPSPLFGPGAPDDLKLIVGVGPVLERMLHQLGVATYRQIARWSEREIDEFDAKLPEFPGRIRRDGWVTQARELHQSKYGETLPPRGR